MFQSKGFTFEDCTIIGTEEIGYMIDYNPTLFMLKYNQTGISMYLLSIPPGSSSNILKYYGASKKLYENLIDYITPIAKLHIIGHSSGSALALSFINTYYQFSPRYIDIYCITTGLGKCDNYLLDTFEYNLKTHSIEFYDLINMMGEPYNERCYNNYFIDDRILRTTCSSMYSLDIFNKNEIDFNISSITVENIRDNIIESHKILHDTLLDQLPPNYDEYYEVLLSNLDKYKNDQCFTTNSLFDCIDIMKLFNRHLTVHTYGMVVNNYGNSTLIEYNKNTLLNVVLGEGKWDIDSDYSRIILNNNAINMCFTGTAIKYNARGEEMPSFGAHTLKSYYTQLISDNK